MTPRTGRTERTERNSHKAQTSLSTATDAAAREFLDNLTAMATGSYLRDEDKEFWEPPYPAAVVDEAQKIVHSLVSAGRAIGQKDPAALTRIVTSAEIMLDDTPVHRGQSSTVVRGETDQGPDETAGASQPDAISLALAAVITPDLRKLADLSEDHDNAILEDEEIQDLLELIGALASELHASPAVLRAHTEAVLID